MASNINGILNKLSFFNYDVNKPDYNKRSISDTSSFLYVPTVLPKEHLKTQKSTLSHNLSHTDSIESGCPEDFDPLDCPSDEEHSDDSYSMASSNDWTRVEESASEVTRDCLRLGKVMLAPSKQSMDDWEIESYTSTLDVSSACSLVTDTPVHVTETLGRVMEPFAASKHVADAKRLLHEFFQQYAPACELQTDAKVPLAYKDDDIVSIATTEDLDEPLKEGDRLPYIGNLLKANLRPSDADDKLSLLHFKINGYRYDATTDVTAAPRKGSKKAPRRRRYRRNFSAVQLWADEDEELVDEGKTVVDEQWRVPSDAMFENLWRPEDDALTLFSSSDDVDVFVTRSSRHDHFPTLKQMKKTTQCSGRLGKTMRSKKSPY